MNVLSLFDGCSCGQQALERANIKVNNYFASEIDKYAIKVTIANYPNTIQLGSVVDVKGADLPKIDLLIGGSPCQSFSFAGKRKGMATKCNQDILTLEQYLQLKEEGFQFEGQSYLFWEYVRILNEVKPKYFLLENVLMEEKWSKIITKTLGVHPIEINSNLVSAQNRRRLYWTNIGLKPAGLFGDLESIIQQPKDKGILIKDILESDVNEKYFLSEKLISYFEKNSEKQKQKGNGFIFKPAYLESKSKTLTMKAGNRMDDNFIIHNLQKRSPDRPSLKNNPNAGGSGHLSRGDGKTYCLDTACGQAVEIVAMRGRGQKGNIEQKIESNNTEKSNSLTTVQKDNLIYTKNYIQWEGNGYAQDNKAYFEDGKAGTLDTKYARNKILTSINSRIRRLTPIECERLQTMKDNYTNHVSDSQRYKMIGNGWTVEVIKHIFLYIE